ncbi:hypothetical protein [Knoellia aerolata]|uniref:hypothetical protein n=1 Tax=Knoellia aerolata TaxID=442954 RepID=UPI0012ED2CB4|nr:hypothetical protein [Knoellia aerolata]
MALDVEGSVPTPPTAPNRRGVEWKVTYVSPGLYRLVNSGDATAEDVSWEAIYSSFWADSPAGGKSEVGPGESLDLNVKEQKFTGSVSVDWRDRGRVIAEKLEATGRP